MRYSRAKELFPFSVFVDIEHHSQKVEMWMWCTDLMGIQGSSYAKWASYKCCKTSHASGIEETITEFVFEDAASAVAFKMRFA